MNRITVHIYTVDDVRIAEHHLTTGETELAITINDDCTVWFDREQALALVRNITQNLEDLDRRRG